MDREIKFEAGDAVSFYHQGNKRLPGEFDNTTMGVDVMADMRGTYVIGFNDVAKNKNRGDRSENRYLIENFHGWWPAHQRNSGLLNPDIEFANFSGNHYYLYDFRREREKIYLDKKCCFAFESELRLLRTQYKT